VVGILREVIIYLFIYLFVWRVCLQSFALSTLFFRSAFDFQMLKIKQYMSTDSAGRYLLVEYTVCSKSGEIFLCL
jgi:hypothetical protein